MGKPTGFLEYERRENPCRAALSRIENYNEFHPQLEKKERAKQGARCMNCGVPFCQSGMTLNGMVTGCPLHNLIPEWNDEIYHEAWGHALSRLLKTNNFPEFTGRVCPALCEAACTCGMNDDPVTIRENELAVIENAYASGLIVPKKPPVRTDKRVAIIGSGPSGLAAADQLNHRGHNVTVFEREDRPGGLLMYGIPNMKLEKSVVERKCDIMRAEGVEFKTNANVGADVDAKTLLDEYDAIVLCCGAKRPRDLNVEGRDGAGVYFAVDYLTAATRSVLEHDDSLAISAKGKNVVIVGGGDTGNDCVGTSIRQGAISVTQIEMMKKLPDTRAENNPWPQWPRICKTDYGQQEAIALFGHDPRIYEHTVKKIVRDEKGNITQIVIVKVEFVNKDGRNVMTEVAGSEKTLDCDILIIAAGFLGCENYVADAFGLKPDMRGRLDTQQSDAPGKIFTAGDMRRGQSLVVWAITEGRAVARKVDEFLMEYTNIT